MTSNPDEQRREAATAFAEHIPYRPRAAHQAFAYLGGYFWLPCPLCGEHFGGHEWRDINGLSSSIPDPNEHPGPG